jgi:hypothetical protein
VSTDDRDAAQGGRPERKLVPGILEEHDAFFRDVARVVPASEGIDDTADGRIVDDACGKHAAQNPAIHAVATVHRNLSLGNCTLERRAEEVVSGHFLIKAGVCGLRSAVGRLPVRNNPALEAEVFLEYMVQQVVVSQA